MECHSGTWNLPKAHSQCSIRPLSPALESSPESLQKRTEGRAGLGTNYSQDQATAKAGTGC